MRTRLLEIKPERVLTILESGLLLSLLFWLPFNAASQDVPKRPTVGLVLSGGGAHGIAHLGVIKVMEEAGLRPDYITGVSMGSIIGGLYSLGYNADSLYRILKKINWDLILSNKIPDNRVIFLEKSTYDNSIISLPISARKVMLPSGLINGQIIENELSYYTWPAADISDFSKLPIPFLCVATDIISYKKIDLKTGYLSDAIRASFSVPSIFTPLKIDTLLLVDGGLIRNFAASEAKAMGADILIGSYAGFRANKEDDLMSVSGIIKQIAFFRSLEDFREEKKLINVLINPVTEKFSVTGFENIDSLVEKGYEAALPYKEYFRHLADSLNIIECQKPLENILDKQTYAFDKIEITGNKSYSDFQILGVLDIKPGQKVDKNLLKDKIELLWGKEWFEKVKYRVIPRNDSLVLVIECAEQSPGKLYGSVHYNNSTNAGIILGLNVKNPLTQRSEVKFNSFISKYYRFEFSAIQFIDRNQKYGLSIDFMADNSLIPLLAIRGEKGNVLTRNFSPGLSISRTIGLNHIMTLSMKYENMSLIPRFVSQNKIRRLSYSYLTSTYSYQINSVNSKYFTKSGTILNISASTSKLFSGYVRTDSSRAEIYSDDNDILHSKGFFTLYGHLKHFFRISRNTTLSIGGDILYITKTDSVSEQNNFFLLGGVESVNNRSVPFIGYQSNELSVRKMAGIRSDIDFELFKNIHLELMGNLAVARAGTYDNEYSLYAGYGMGAGYMSIIGPLRLGIMYGNDRQEYISKIKGYLTIGFKF